MSKDKIQKRITEEICHFLPQGKRIKERKKHRSDRLEGRVTEKDVLYTYKGILFSPKKKSAISDKMDET